MSDDADITPAPLSIAELAAIAMPPALVAACQEDPEILVALARGQLAIIQDRMIRKGLSNPDTSVAQFAIIHERLSKIARIETQAPGAGPSQTVTINIIRAPGKDQVVIEGQSQRVEGSK